MKTLLAMAVGTANLLATGVSSAQNGNMMGGAAGVMGGGGDGGWMGGGGYGGIWLPTLLVVVVVGVAAWIVTHKRK